MRCRRPAADPPCCCSLRAYRLTPQPSSSTNFNSWTAEEIKAFLDRRGGDYDDCQTFQQLVRTAGSIPLQTAVSACPTVED